MAWRDRIVRFADLFVDPVHGNFSPQARAFVATHVGSGGAGLTPYRYSPPFTDGEALYEWSERHAVYGLPLDDVPGVGSFEDLRRPELAARMGRAMNERLARGDTAVSLTSTGLVTLAHLATGHEKYRAWVLDYVEAWPERARKNGGLVPDNVGQSGVVGEYHGGRWYGGLYGWQWPHGLSPILSAAQPGTASASRRSPNGERQYPTPPALSFGSSRGRW